MAGPYRFIGKATPRKDAVEIVTGTGQFLDDIKLPGMLYGKVLRSPHAHALIKEIDKSLAEKIPGVRGCSDLERRAGLEGGNTPFHPRP